MPELEIPPGIPMNIEQKLRELHSAAQQYREKIADLESKPENEQFGLAMTQKLLANVEKQMNTLLSRYN